MSSLGIRFALPYKGSNGLKVTNNVIGLDENGLGSIGALVIAANAEDPLAIANTQYGSLIVWSSQDNGIYNTVFRDTFSTDEIMRIEIDGNVDNTTGGGSLTSTNLTATSDITSNTGNLYLRNDGGGQANIHFNEQKLNQANLLVLPETTGTVVPATTKYIPVTINGVSYKLIIAN